MSYELKKPFTAKEKADFIVEYNHNQGLKIEDTEMFLFALEADEIMGEKEIEIEVVDPETEETHIETITIPYPVINPDYEQEQEEAREREFNKAFFNTSLGYVRRLVTMADGSHKDFLADILPLLEVGVEIITYNADMTQNTGVAVTAQFIQECKQQVLKDFYGNIQEGG